MNNTEVRKHLRKGELATALAEALGYTFGTDPENSNRDIWIAPPAKPEDSVAKAVKDLIEAQTKAQVDAFKKAQVDPFRDPRGPNWHTLEPMIGKLFRVRQDNIPEKHPLHGFGDAHFAGVNYRAQSIQYERSPEYTGYTVSFSFRLRPYGIPSLVRLPLSCAAFQP
jgi:hypothetical protein